MHRILKGNAHKVLTTSEAINKLRHYLFVDQVMLNNYFDQINASLQTELKQTKKVGLSITGPHAEIVEEATKKTLNTHEKIESLISFLKENDELATRRPIEDYVEKQYDKAFILETMMARKIIIPSKFLEDMCGIRQIAIWISDPCESDYRHRSSFDPNYGTFLYLTEMRFDDSDDYHSLWSGCSALQVIVNAVNGEILPFGRCNNDHPSEKLQHIGSVVGDSRQITSLYVKRLFSNEQSYRVNGEKRRVNDLLGYPIFISAGF